MDQLRIAYAYALLARTLLPPGPFSADEPRIAAVDWISVDEQGYLVVEGKAG